MNATSAAHRTPVHDGDRLFRLWVSEVSLATRVGFKVERLYVDACIQGPRLDDKVLIGV